ncbi:MAG: DUF3179 domain-containing protein [candidate division NC10 bacterium]|nr:DUF3179 domain-containing protein [candidate division NC10 bacterium]
MKRSGLSVSSFPPKRESRTRVFSWIPARARYAAPDLIGGGMTARNMQRISETGHQEEMVETAHRLEDEMVRRTWKWLFVGLVAFAASMGGSGPALAGTAGPFSEVVNGAPIMTVLPKDAIPAIDHPTFVSATEGDRVMQPEEPVLGLTDGKVAKAYSLWQLNHHEIVNDQLGTLPIAVTW